MNGERHQILDDFFNLGSNEQRENYFRIRQAAQLDRIYPLLAEDERLTITTVLHLPDPYKTEICHNLCGNATRGINGTRRSFTVEPTGESVRMEMGTRNNKRMFFTLGDRESLAADLVINLLDRYGPKAEIESQCGLIREVPPRAPIQEEFVDEDPSDPDKESKTRPTKSK